MITKTFKTRINEIAEEAFPYAIGALGVVAIMAAAYVGSTFGTISVLKSVVNEAQKSIDLAKNV